MTDLRAANPRPRTYCQKCGYALFGLTSNVCPECGRKFDPHDSRTFATRPRRGIFWRWTKRALLIILLLIAAAGMEMGWLWWGWHSEQKIVAQLRGPDKILKFKVIGPDRYGWLLGNRWSYLRNRVQEVALYSRASGEIPKMDFTSLHHIDKLAFYDCALDNKIMSQLSELKSLQCLILWCPKGDKLDLAFLKSLPHLSILSLSGTKVDETSFTQIAAARELKSLSLNKVYPNQPTGITDANLKYLQQLPALQTLSLNLTPITDAGLKHLQSIPSLRDVSLYETPATPAGIASLKQAIPGVKVH